MSSSEKLAPLCISHDGISIVYDPVHSHAATHFEDTPSLKQLVVGLLQTYDIRDKPNLFDVAMGQVIGTSDVVRTSESDRIVYAIRRLREDQGYVPFTKSQPAQPSSYISVGLEKRTNTEYELSSAWIGRCDEPPFPQQAHATSESIPYWNSHAFVWGSQAIEPGTELTTRPW